ncbi:HAD family hydrolase [Silvimonas iriomotensis]|nr:HAD family phosphatase [Silvimonas iriomotensis]
MSFPPLQAAIFDMDGLMLDTERIAIDCWASAARELQLQMHDQVPYGMVGMHMSKVPAYLLAELGPDAPVQQLIDATHACYLEATAKAIPHRPGVIALLDWLRERGVPCAVATSSRRSVASHHLQAAGLWPYFEFAVCGDEIEHPKPAPDIYIKAATGLGRQPAECVAFEDSNFGIAAAHSAGCRAIMVPDLRPPTAETMALGVPVVESLSAAQPIVEAWLRVTTP